MDKPLNLGIAGSNPGQDIFDDFHSANAALDQIHEPMAFTARFPFDQSDKPDPFEDVSPRNTSSLQTIDPRMISS